MACCYFTIPIYNRFQYAKWFGKVRSEMKHRFNRVAEAHRLTDTCSHHASTHHQIKIHGNVWLRHEHHTADQEEAKEVHLENSNLMRRTQCHCFFIFIWVRAKGLSFLKRSRSFIIWIFAFVSLKRPASRNFWVSELPDFTGVSVKLLKELFYNWQSDPPGLWIPVALPCQ